MAIDDGQDDQERKWPLGPDIVEECQAVSTIPNEESNEWNILFDP